MGTVLVNGTPVEIGASERLNVIQAADKVGVEVPRYCWHPALTVVASCRMCLVETGEKKPDGTIAMGPKLVPGCQTPVKDGMVIVTNSEKVKAAQAQTSCHCTPLFDPSELSGPLDAGNVGGPDPLTRPFREGAQCGNASLPSNDCRRKRIPCRPRCCYLAP